MIKTYIMSRTKKTYNEKVLKLKKSVTWNCCFFSSVTFRRFSHSLILFFTFSLESQIDTYVNSHHPKKKKKNTGFDPSVYLSIFYALSLLTVFWEISGFIHQIVSWNSFCLVLSNHGFQFFIGWHFRYFQAICFWSEMLIIVCMFLSCHVRVSEWIHIL